MKELEVVICPAVAGSPSWQSYLAVLAVLLAKATLENNRVLVIIGAEHSILGSYRCYIDWSRHFLEPSLRHVTHYRVHYNITLV